MFLVYAGIYLLFLLVIWGFFGVAWVHAHKFSNFSTHITFVSRALFIVLFILTILGFFLIYLLSISYNSFSINTAKTTIENQNYY